MGQRWSFSGQSHGQDAAPVMSNDHGLLLVALDICVHAILCSQSHNELSQLLQHVGRSVFLQAVGSSISRKVNGDDRHGLLQSRVLDDMAPNGPAVRESMDEDDQRLPRVNGFRGVRSIVAQEVKLESALQGQEVVRETFEVL